MIPGRLVPVIISIGVGIGTGIFVFQPLIKEYEAETKGTWILPEDRERIAALETKKQDQKDKQQ
ncbi:unnamed protein product [Cunninghamella blakesleeana]